MKIKTHTLSGRALDYAVAVIEKMPIRRDPMGLGDGSYWVWPEAWPPPSPGYQRIGGTVSPTRYSPTTMVLGDDIIDREWIGTRPPWTATAPNGYELTPPGWYATIRKGDTTYIQHGDTRREAAMRCFVASRLGDEIDLPEDLS